MRRILNTTGSVPLEFIESTSVLEGAPLAGALPLTAVAGAEVGVWEMSPGHAMDVEADEVFVVLAGEGTVAFEDGEVVELKPGTAVRLHAGDRTEWSIHSTLRKLYFS